MPCILVDVVDDVVDDVVENSVGGQLLLTENELSEERAYRCFQLKTSMVSERRRLYHFVDEIVVRHLRSSKRARDRVVHTLTGLRVLEMHEQSGGLLVEDFDWVRTWVTCLDVPDTVAIAHCLFKRENREGHGKVATILKELGGAQRLMLENSDSSRVVLTGHDILKEFPGCKGKPMNEVMFVHKMWCDTKIRQREDDDGTCTDITISKEDAIQWLRDVYMPSAEKRWGR